MLMLRGSNMIIASNISIRCNSTAVMANISATSSRGITGWVYLVVPFLMVLVVTVALVLLVLIVLVVPFSALTCDSKTSSISTITASNTCFGMAAKKWELLEIIAFRAIIGNIKTTSNLCVFTSNLASF